MSADADPLRGRSGKTRGLTGLNLFNKLLLTVFTENSTLLAPPRLQAEVFFEEN